MSVYNLNKIKRSVYVPINIKKYVGKDINKIICRSGLERKFCKICDHSKNILEWSSESITIPYKKMYQTKKSRYIMDFWIKKKVGNKIKEFLVEIKPYDFLSPPKIQKRKTQRYIDLIENYSTNVAKWSAADEYCKKHNMSFAIVTDRDLN